MRDDPKRARRRRCGSSPDRPHPTLSNERATFSRKREKERAAKALLCAIALVAATPALAQAPPKPRIPDLFDPNQRVQKLDAGQVKSIRFLTTDDFPPFHFALPDGTLAGFDIDLARAVCSDLKLACTNSQQVSLLLE